jgi:hypothetical protein
VSLRQVQVGRDEPQVGAERRPEAHQVPELLQEEGPGQGFLPYYAILPESEMSND